MAQGEAVGSAVARDVRTLFGAGTFGSATDAQLLARFRTREPGEDGAAEAAFAVLVERHGPMVLGVCRRTLRNPADVDDAFQATFLVLARKAASVDAGDSLGRWLHGVSQRVSARARVDSARRNAREGGPMPSSGPVDPAGPTEDRELLAALDEEVSRLPAPFRETITLCDLSGLTHEAAARVLGCPVGTVESRLHRARRKLRDRLTRRGFAPSVVGLVRAVKVPESLSVSTARAAFSAGSVSPSVSTLLARALTDMAWIRIKTIAAGLGALALLGGFGFVLASRIDSADPPKAAARPDQDDAALGLKPAEALRPGDRVQIEVLEALPGRPITGTRVVRPDGTVSLGFYGDLPVAGLNRKQIKEKVVRHLRRWLSDHVLGLVALDDAEEKEIKVEPADTNRVFVDESPLYEDRPANYPKGLVKTTVRPGDLISIEVLEALPGRPITGYRIVHGDGRVSLGFYGELAVAGLTRGEIKERVVDHLRRWLTDEQLGLTERGDEGNVKKVEPANSCKVLVDDRPSDVAARGPSKLPAGEGPRKAKPGDLILIEVLQALPGRPLSGERLVRPDGTVSLGFYGDLKVAGLTRQEIKIKTIEHLLPTLTDETLGLVETDLRSGKSRRVEPADSAAVFVEDDLDAFPEPTAKEPAAMRTEVLNEMQRRIDRLELELRALRAGKK